MELELGSGKRGRGGERERYWLQMLPMLVWVTLWWFRKLATGPTEVIK